MANLENIHNSQNAKLGQQPVVHHKDAAAAQAFVAAYKQAEKTIQVPQSDKKKKDEWQKQRGRNLNKQDYEHKDELDEILEEIDKRINQLLQLAEEERG